MRSPEAPTLPLMSQLTGGVRLAVAAKLVKPEPLLDPPSSRPTTATMLPPTSAAMMDRLEYRRSRLKRATRNDRIGAWLLSIRGQRSRRSHSYRRSLMKVTFSSVLKSRATRVQREGQVEAERH